MNDVLIAFSLSLSLTLIAIWKRSLTKFGSFIAFTCAFIICFFGTYKSFVILALFYFILLVSDKISKNEKEKLEKSVEDGNSKRDFLQVLSNIGVATISILIFKLTNNTIFYISYAVALAAAIADTMSSNIGILSKEVPFNIFKFTRGKKGLSGNMTFLGLFSGLFGAFLIALAYVLLNGFDLKIFLVITILGLIGSIFDSFLGTFFEGKYKCTYCSNITEKKRHCNNETMLIKGFRFFNNNLVNFLNTLFCFLISILVL